MISNHCYVLKNEFSSMLNPHLNSHLKHDFMTKIGQTGHRKLKFWNKFMNFFPHFNHVSLFIDILPSFNDQKRIQHTKLHRKSVLSFNIINRIVKTGHKIVKKWSKTTQNQKLWLLRSFCANMTSESIFNS